MKLTQELLSLNESSADLSLFKKFVEKAQDAYDAENVKACVAAIANADKALAKLTDFQKDAVKNDIANLKYLKNQNGIKESQLTEGFSGLSVIESDKAADAFYDIKMTVIKKLEKILKDKGNAYNTPGYVNAAMIMNEYLKVFAENDHGDDFAELSKKIYAMMEKDRDSWVSGKGSTGVKDDYIKLMKDFKKNWL